MKKPNAIRSLPLIEKYLIQVSYNTLRKCKTAIQLILPAALVLMFSACSVTKKINRQADAILLKDSVIGSGHIGISLYEPATDKYWYNLNAAKYFTPASNTKLFSLYAGLKYLGDSLIAARYWTNENNLFILPAGDPTFLHPDFNKQPLLDLIDATRDTIFISLRDTIPPFGQGWAWDDFDQGYVAERSMLPVLGNQLWLSPKPVLTKNLPGNGLTDTTHFIAAQSLYIQPSFFTKDISYQKNAPYARKQYQNKFLVDSITRLTNIPFISNNGITQLEILGDITHKFFKTFKSELKPGEEYTVLKSQPTDSMLTPMMHNSDNFFAEQTLLMASNEQLGFMNDAAIIDTLLKKDLTDIPQKPGWVDGSGLSRYNLFTPQSFVYLLNKMKNEFGLERLKIILPTGGTGTLKNYYVADSNFIYAKTGSLTGCIALSGYLITRKNKLLIFSVLTNNFKGRATVVRRAVEKFISGVRRDY